MDGWRWASARRRGTSHVRSGTACQDAHRVVATPDGDGVVVVVSDGAGSAIRGGAGAYVTVRTMAASVEEHLSASGALPDDELLWSWMDAVRDRIAAAAAARGLVPRDFAATLAMVVQHGGESVIALVGDGVVAVREVGRWEVPSWPEHGEYASTTFFVTDEPHARMRIVRPAGRPDALMVMSDGLERLALDFGTSTPHAPFFDALIGPVDRAGSVGRLHSLSRSLHGYLDRPEVNARTDDDKTLVIAARG